MELKERKGPVMMCPVQMVHPLRLAWVRTNPYLQGSFSASQCPAVADRVQLPRNYPAARYRQPDSYLIYKLVKYMYVSTTEGRR